MIDLGITPQQFMDSTPRFLAVLRYRLRIKFCAEHLHEAVLCMSYINVHRDREKQPDAVTLEHFLPGITKLLDLQGPPAERPQTSAEQIAMMTELTMAFRAAKGINNG